MTELIEAVARAICHDEWTTPGTDLKPEAVARVVDHEWEHWSSVAQAALTAITDAGYRIVPGWQPIETAPKDGTPFVGAIKVRVNGYPPEWFQYIIAYDPERDELSLDYDTGWDLDDYLFWMPLPAAPGDEM